MYDTILKTLLINETFSLCGKTYRVRGVVNKRNMVEVKQLFSQYEFFMPADRVVLTNNTGKPSTWGARILAKENS